MLWKRGISRGAQPQLIFRGNIWNMFVISGHLQLWNHRPVTISNKMTVLFVSLFKNAFAPMQYITSIQTFHKCHPNYQKKNCQIYWLLYNVMCTYLESSWKIHHNEYKHAYGWSSGSWDSLLCFHYLWTRHLLSIEMCTNHSEQQNNSCWIRDNSSWVIIKMKL